jgi:hypothetical protein
VIFENTVTLAKKKAGDHYDSGLVVCLSAQALVIEPAQYTVFPNRHSGLYFYPLF